jgi:hypothetical protein
MCTLLHLYIVLALQDGFNLEQIHQFEHFRLS